VQHSLCTGGVELENLPATTEIDIASRASAAKKGGSVQVSRSIPGHTGFGPGSVRKIATTVKWIKLSESLRRR